ncbi:MAG: DUF4388 domain-containing protein [Actinomycetota bacterium]
MLQGSLDNFALDEVLGLLESTSKTGRLEVTGNRGKGTLRLHQGELVDAVASITTNGVEPEAVVFELLRFEEGTFSFDTTDHEDGSFAQHVSSVLSGAEARLADWRTIEAVVPSLRHMVTPIPSLPEEEVAISRQEWATLIAIAAGCPASHVCEELGLGEVEGSRQIMGLAQRGLVAIGEPKLSPTSGPGMRRATTPDSLGTRSDGRPPKPSAPTARDLDKADMAVASAGSSSAMSIDALASVGAGNSNGGADNDLLVRYLKSEGER